MSAHDVDDQVREALDGFADSIDVSNLLPLSAVGPLAERRSRRRQVMGGLATVLLVAMVTVSVGLVRQDDKPSAVFAGEVDQPLVPGVVAADGDRFVGLAVLSPFDLDDQGNARLAVVASVDGERWDRVEDAPVLVVNGALLGLAQGVFHVVGTRGVDAVDLDGTPSIEHDLVHATSTDLVSWSETVHPLPDEVDGDNFRTSATDMAFVDAGPIVLLSHYANRPEVEAEVEALGLDMADLCYHVGESNRTGIRPCGDSEFIAIPTSPSSSYLVEYELAMLHGGPVRYVDLPEVDDGRSSIPPVYESALYQTDDGVGMSGRDVFETTDGIRWDVVDLGHEPAVMMAVRGAERVFRSAVHVERFGADDPVTGMGYSSDGGETWAQVNVDDLFVGEEIGQKRFGELTAAPDGWVVVAGRALQDRPAVSGVEREGPGASKFTISVDGYVLEGSTPFGEAELRNPSGVVVRSWEHLETANPLWSGLEIDGDQIIIRTENGSESITVTADQWNVLVDPPGFNTFDVLFSPDGTNWTVLDTSSSVPRVLATTSGGVLVQRLATGIYSDAAPPVELVPFPVADAE